MIGMAMPLLREMVGVGLPTARLALDDTARRSSRGLTWRQRARAGAEKTHNLVVVGSSPTRPTTPLRDSPDPQT